MGRFNYIIISGFGWSGSSALVDLLREYENIGFVDTEFRLFYDPYGIDDLKHNIVDNWSYINSTAAIENFLLMTKRYARSGRFFFQPFGLSYKKVFGKKYYNNCKEYIDNLTLFKYTGTSAYHKTFKSSYLNCSFERLSKGLSHRFKWLRLPYRKKKAYFSHPSSECFTNETKKFINKLFAPFFNSRNNVLLDQAVSPLRCDDLKYFDNGKMIVVDRDPRDIYADLINSRGLIGEELAKTTSVDKFVEWYKNGRNAFVASASHVGLKDILFIKFENLVLDSENTMKRITDFLGIDLGKRIYKETYFKPQCSAKNIGIYKKMNILDNELVKLNQLYSIYENSLTLKKEAKE